MFPVFYSEGSDERPTRFFFVTLLLRTYPSSSTISSRADRRAESSTRPLPFDIKQARYPLSPDGGATWRVKGTIAALRPTRCQVHVFPDQRRLQLLREAT